MPLIEKRPRTFEEWAFNFLIFFVMIGMPALSLYLLFGNS
jgi:hypothetical protein